MKLKIPIAELPELPELPERQIKPNRRRWTAERRGLRRNLELSINGVLKGLNPELSIKGVLKGLLAFLQYFKFMNWWFRFFDVTNRLKDTLNNLLS